MKNKEFACFLNSPYLGGAERSFCQQARDLKLKGKASTIRFYVPYLKSLEETKQLKNFILENDFRNNDIFFYKYHPFLYEFSRGSGISGLFSFPKMFLGLVFTINELSKLQLRNPDTWWIGGNKVGFVVFLLGAISSFKGRLLWHFRDYPYAQGLFKMLPFIFKLPHSFELDAVGNSYDVANAIKKSPFPFKNVFTLYNPVGDFKFTSRHEGELVFGTASMLAPWKGVHAIIQFVIRNKKNLKKMGYKNFYIYGDQIYQTKGAHSHYKKALHMLMKDFQNISVGDLKSDFDDLRDNNDEFIIFKGLKSPQEIYQELDVFIHSSLSKEPFGRVIPEAMKAGSLVISTGLGGSGELFDESISGLKYYPHNDASLLRALEIGSSEERFNIIQKAKLRSTELASIYEKQLLDVF